ncbi:hypothetical protein CSPHI_02055 [Corynebacterium sphenisci DSM 44792]|uniref:Uncharacterized protein n=1 Tax=Corynebacterium sphenisci DSM 44792 TaxID=1437874 RepID=A0A1L7CW72_9CORY|nr:hypothetical protein [Corynebacterium sphenisci]APT90061.1 hypothetical protein CSPHI_02055 [Corynebacterium sphenisci DSM 44792]
MDRTRRILVAAIAAALPALVACDGPLPGLEPETVTETSTLPPVTETETTTTTTTEDRPNPTTTSTTRTRTTTATPTRTQQPTRTHHPDPGVPDMETAVMGPYASWAACEDARANWPVASEPCAPGDDGRYYFRGQRQAA